MSVPIYTVLKWANDKGTVRVKCLAQEHNTVSPARARTRTARSGDEHTNHEATGPPLYQTCGKYVTYHVILKMMYDVVSVVQFSL